MAVGYDHLDLPAIKERNIKVGYTPDVLTQATAELTLALLLATSRRLFEASEQLRRYYSTVWKFRIFLLLRFSVKSILAKFVVSKIAILTFLESLNFSQLFPE